jgi:hypothetical protein
VTTAEIHGPVERRPLLASLAALRYGDHALLALMVAAITGLNQLWLSLETRPPHWDKARHLTNALVYRDLFASGDLWGALVDYHYYPPLVYWVADLFYAVLGTTEEWAAVLSQSAFLAVLALSTYGLGKELWSRRSGLLAALFVVTSPMLVSLFKDVMLDAPLTAVAALALYLLVKSDGFSSRRFSLLFGAVTGLGLLTKWSFALALALPAAYAVAVAFLASLRGRSWSRPVNAAGAAALAFVVAGAWYVTNLERLRIDTHRFDTVAASIEGDPPVLSPASILWYPWNLLSNQLYLGPFLFFAIGCVLLLVRPDLRRRNRYPILLAVGTYVAFTLVSNKDARYTLPMLAGVAVLAVYWLELLRPRWRAIAAAALVAYGLFTFAAASFGASFLPRDVSISVGRGCRFYPYFTGPCPGSSIPALQSFLPSGEQVNRRAIRIWSQDGFVSGPPSGERWYQEEMFREAKAEGARTLFFQGPPIDFIWFNGFAMQYFARKYGLVWVASPDQADFAGIRVGRGESASPPAGFGEVGRFSLPDGGELVLYRRGAPPAPGAPAAASLADLRRAAASLDHPLYWAGPRAGVTYELRLGEDGSAVLRYLPPGVAVGDERPRLTVSSYPLDDAYAATLEAAAIGDAVTVPVRGGIAFFNRRRPGSVYLAYRGSPVQVEVSAPSPRVARALVSSGSIQPLERAGP